MSSIKVPRYHDRDYLGLLLEDVDVICLKDFRLQSAFIRTMYRPVRLSVWV